MARSATNVKQKDQPIDTSAKPPRKRGGGKDRFIYTPTEADRTIVKLCRFTGFSQEETARLLNNGEGVSPTCLRDHFKNEWENGKAQMLAKVSGTLFGIATNPRHPQAASSCMFILKSQARWRTTDPLEAEAKVEKSAADDVITFTLKIGERPDAED